MAGGKISIIEILGRKLNFLTQYIFCRSRRDESIDGINSEFYYQEHFFKKSIKFEKKLKRTLSLTGIAPSRMTYIIENRFQSML